MNEIEAIQKEIAKSEERIGRLRNEVLMMGLNPDPACLRDELIYEAGECKGLKKALMHLNTEG